MMRAVVRWGLRLFFLRPRVLNIERIEQPGPAILVIAHPRSLTAALLLVAALERQVYCLLPSTEFHGVFRKLAAWALGVQSCDFTAEEQEAWLNPCFGVLENQGAVALFAGETGQDGARNAAVAGFAARLTVEILLQGQSRMQPPLIPVHWLLGTEHRGPVPLVYVDSPIDAQHFLPKVGEDLAEASLKLVETVRDAMDANIFGLTESELEHFNHELEALSREDLAEQWSQHSVWKQRPEELQLSSSARKWLDHQNRTDPAHLAELRENLLAYRESSRVYSLGEFVVETSGPWQRSASRVAMAWIETVAGFPVALYGLINHLPALAILSATGRLKSSPEKDPKVEWLLRIFIVLSCYTAQILFVHFWWGRAAAGYYTLTLPVSGAYLWRYRWLLRHRIHVLFRKVLHNFGSARLIRQRKEILAKFDLELEHSLQSPGAMKPQAPELAERRAAKDG